jgi:LmbE family N-acetylglucosaminyl deacetylase
VTTVPPRGRLLVVSPHPDDAAFSCAALLAREEPADLLTVFDGTPETPRRTVFNELYGFADSTEATTVRRAEDLAALGGGRHRLTSLGLLDAEYLDGPRPAADAAAIRSAIAAWAAEGDGAVALPAGAGCRWGRVRGRLGGLPGIRIGPVRHADHLDVREAGLAALDGLPAVTPLLYEELPYSWCKGADGQARGAARRWRRRPVGVAVAVDRLRKAARIAVYASQTPHMYAEGGRIDDPDVLPPEERYWWLMPRRPGRASP